MGIGWLPCNEELLFSRGDEAVEVARELGLTEIIDATSETSLSVVGKAFKSENKEEIVP